MYFLIKEEKVFDKYNEIWERVSNIINKEFNSRLAYNKKYLKLKKKRLTQKNAFNIFIYQ